MADGSSALTPRITQTPQSAYEAPCDGSDDLQRGLWSGLQALILTLYRLDSARQWSGRQSPTGAVRMRIA
jgi:hypothetical protein